MKTKAVSFYTPMGVVNVEHLGHASLLFEWEGMHIYTDPYSDVYDYSDCKKADLILITHAHTDHYDTKAIEKIAMPNTTFIISKGVKTCLVNNLMDMHDLNVDNNALNVDPSTNLVNMFTYPKLKYCNVITLLNGESARVAGIRIKAVPAYNIKQLRENGNPFHIKGEGNGYILDMQGFEFYIAGDTELIPEMNDLTPMAMQASGGLDVAFLPKNLPYTMSDKEFISAANLIHPKFLFPIHYFELDKKVLREGIDTGICTYVNGEQI